MYLLFCLKKWRQNSPRMVSTVLKYSVKWQLVNSHMCCATFLFPNISAPTPEGSMHHLKRILCFAITFWVTDVGERPGCQGGRLWHLAAPCPSTWWIFWGMKSPDAGVQSWEVEGEADPMDSRRASGSSCPWSWLQAWGIRIVAASKVSALPASVSWVSPPNL